MNIKIVLLSIYSILLRDIKKFYRQPSRVIGALLPPIIFWILIGNGLNSSFQMQMVNVDYLHYFFPGVLVLIMLFTSIFSTISLIEDKNNNFLQSVLISPTSYISILFGKVFSCTILSFMEGFIFTLFILILKFNVSFGSFLLLLLVILLLSFCLSSMGWLIAWKMKSIQGFHAIMNLLLMPLWFLSGALFPLEGTPIWLYILMLFNPLTYGVLLIQNVLHANYLSSSPFSFSFCFWILFAFSTCIVLLCYQSGKRGYRNI